MQNIDETLTWNSLKSVMAKLPNENEELLPGVKWGSCVQLYTPAFWKFQYLLSDFSHTEVSHRLSSSLIEEVVMCILGGYGIPAEVGIIAFHHLKDQQLICPNASFEEIYGVLGAPMTNEKGKQIRYRFAKQKTTYLHRFLNRNDLECIPQLNDIELRNWLLTIDGIGLKTASWITRNWLRSDNVAIIDIHLFRAGKLTGFFTKNTISDYLTLEKEYLGFCHALEVSASDLDALIWRYMKKNTKLAGKVTYS